MKTDIPRTPPHLDLSDDDFTILVESLDQLLDRDVTGELAATIIGTLIPEDDIRTRRTFEANVEEDRRRRDERQKALRESVRILQGRLYAYRRACLEASASGAHEPDEIGDGPTTRS